MHKRARNHVWLVAISQNSKHWIKNVYKNRMKEVDKTNRYKSCRYYEPQGKRLN